WASGAAVESVPLRDEIAWSADVDRHLALIAEIGVLRERMRSVRTPGLRYQSALLHVVPAETVVFAAVPNYGQTLADAHRLFQERLQESAVLREWWTQVDPARHGGPDLAAVIEKVRSFSDYLGDEVVLAALDYGEPHGVERRVRAEVRRTELREVWEGEVGRMSE